MLLGGVITFGIGVLLTLLGLFTVASARAKLRRLAEVRTTPIATTPTGTSVEITGVVVPSEQGLVTSAATGASGMLCSIGISNLDGSIYTLHRSREQREFWLRDDRGDHARIVPDQSELVLTKLRFMPGPPQRYLPDPDVHYLTMEPELEAWAARTANSQARLMVEQQLIAAGERLFVQGFAERDPNGTLWLRASRDRPLLLTTHTESELVAYRQSQQRLGWLLTALFLGICAIGAAIAAAGWYFEL